jgi:hypothetical protein
LGGFADRKAIHPQSFNYSNCKNSETAGGRKTKKINKKINKNKNKNKEKA